MDLMEELEKARRYERFRDLARLLFEGGENEHKAAAALLERVKPGSYKEVVLISLCGQYGAVEAIPQIISAFEHKGPGRQDARVASVHALVHLLTPTELGEFLPRALSDSDVRLAEAAAISAGFIHDPLVVEPLLRWLHQRLQKPRTKNQALVTSEIIALCRRLSSPDQAAQLAQLLDRTKLTPVEQIAAAGEYVGQSVNPAFPREPGPDQPSPR